MMPSPPPSARAQFIEEAEEKLSHPKYRPDIDGLRAVAVLSVVAFHAFPRWMPGGFIGVDVFFVISGFLISTIIFENLEKNTFSFVGFYARRVRRIFPALLLVLISSYAFGWIALFADEYKQLGKHIAAGAGFVSNLVLWSESGYFDNASDTKPLLHLWSLGIEEQFYIVWPFVLWLAWKKRFNLLTLIILVWFASFYLNIQGVQKDAVATFYSPQTRFWELFAGSMLAWLVLHNKNTFSNCALKIDGFLSRIVYREHAEADGTLSNITSFSGCLLLAYGFWRITKATSFPGWWGIVPVLGAVLIILAGSRAWINRTVLSNKIAVWFGLISFPLYLWHWPLLSFARIVESGTPARNIRIAAVALSVALAWLTYKFVERPIRFGKNRRIKAFVLVFLMVVVGYVGYNAYARDGLKFRKVLTLLNKEFVKGYDGGSRGNLISCGVLDEMCRKDKRGNVRFAIMGDSKAGSLAPGLVRSSNDSGRWLVMSKAGVLMYPIQNAPLTTELAIQAIVSNQDIEVVVLAGSIRSLFPGNYPAWVDGKYNGAYMYQFTPNQELLNKVFEHLSRGVDVFVSAGKKVVLVVDNPSLDEVRDCIKRVTSLTFFNRLLDGSNNNFCAVSLSEFYAHTKGYREMFAKIESNHPGSVFVFDPTDIYCDTAENVCKVFRYGRPMYGNTDHISDFAAGLVGAKLNGFIKKVIDLPSENK